MACEHSAQMRGQSLQRIGDGAFTLVGVASRLRSGRSADGTEHRGKRVIAKLKRHLSEA